MAATNKEQKNITLTWLQTIGLIISIVVSFGGVCIYLGEQKHELASNTLAIKELTRAVNCHITGGSDDNCVVKSTVGLK